VASAARALPLAAIALFVIAARVNLLNMPLERDDGTYAYLGQLVLDGETPYVSFYETKPPLLHYAYAAVTGIFGQTLEGLHRGFLIVNLATTLLLFRVARILFERRFANVVAACFAVLALTPTASGYTAQSEHLVALGVSAGLWLTLEALGRGRRALLALAGASLAAACLVKQTALFSLVWVLLLPALRVTLGGERRWRIALAELLPGALGAVTVILLTLLSVALQGALEGMWYWTVEVPRYYGSQVEWGFGIQQLFFHLERVAGRYLVIWGLAAVGLCTLRIGGLGRFEQWLIAGFAVAGAASIVPGLRFYGHYWLQLMPAVALLCGAAARELEQRLAGRVRLRPVHATALSAVLVAAIAAEALARDLDYYRGRQPARIVREVYGANPFLEAQVVGNFVRERTRPGERLVVIGSEPELYFYADRRCPSRHAYFEYTIASHPDGGRFQREFFADVERDPPRTLVFFGHEASYAGDIDVEAYVRAIDWYVDFARAHYRPIAMVDGSDPLHPVLVTGPEMARVQRAGTSRVLVLERVEAPPRPVWVEPFDPLCGQSALIPPGHCPQTRAAR
jgi:4-amino-4-deoxy-L-arabinose transferase-like glycosyltransferase